MVCGMKKSGMSDVGCRVLDGIQIQESLQGDHVTLSTFHLFLFLFFCPSLSLSSLLLCSSLHSPSPLIALISMEYQLSAGKQRQRELEISTNYKLHQESRIKWKTRVIHFISSPSLLPVPVPVPASVSSSWSSSSLSSSSAAENSLSSLQTNHVLDNNKD